MPFSLNIVTTVCTANPGKLHPASKDMLYMQISTAGVDQSTTIHHYATHSLHLKKYMSKRKERSKYLTQCSHLPNCENVDTQAWLMS